MLYGKLEIIIRMRLLHMLLQELKEGQIMAEALFIQEIPCCAVGLEFTASSSTKL